MKLHTGNHEGIMPLACYPVAIQSAMDGKPLPVYAEIAPSETCNHACPFCFTEFAQSETVMSEELLFRIMRDLGAWRLPTLEIQGIGEPLLCKSLARGIVLGKTLGIKHICLTTNGVLANEEFLSTAVPSLTYLKFSSMEYDAAKYAYTHGCDQKDHAIVLHNIETACRIRDETKSPCKITVTVMMTNQYEDAYKLAKQMKDIGVDHIQFKTAGRHQNNKGQAWLGFREVEWRNVEPYVALLASEKFFVSFRYDFTTDQKPCERNYSTCHALGLFIHIAADGKIYPCFAHWKNDRYCLGDLSKQHMGELCYSDAFYAAINRVKAETDIKTCAFGCKQDKPNAFLDRLIHPIFGGDVL